MKRIENEQELDDPSIQGRLLQYWHYRVHWVYQKQINLISKHCSYDTCSIPTKYLTAYRKYWIFIPGYIWKTCIHKTRPKIKNTFYA